MWDANERSYRRRNTEKAGKASRRVIVVEEIVERNKETRKKEVVSSFEEGKSREIEEYRINPQELTTMVSFDERKEEETASYRKEEKSPQGDEETSKVEKQETLCFILESPRFLNSWEETEMEDEYSVESEYYDWISGISQPRSYWDGLRKQREKEIMMNKDPKKDYMRDMIKKKTVSTFLASDFREEIDKMISCAQKKIQVEINPEEEDSEEWNVECSTSYQENLEENETEKIDQTVTISDGFSQSSVKSTKSFEDHEAVITSQSNSSNPKDLANTSSYETDVICDLREQIKQLQGEMLELKSLVKSCVDFQKSVKLESFSGV
ncbi:hypothetical protein AALP_AA6G136300 [Arabis alpina]|uniref:Uncharacterized protein n=1 Tax=Arabis alpina TaxID=50452 RepID=A0A087GP14_ARAAL|nr:hypothetical protein AALP_AA6G136300 [Arabis alpina]